MPHQRQVIREAVKAALVHKTAAADRVYETRMVPWRRIELPAVSVYTLEEEVDPNSRASAPRELARTLNLVVEAVAAEADNVDDVLDSLALEIERAMHADETFGGAASDSILSSTEMVLTEEGERLFAHVGLFYTVTYYTYAPEAEDTTLDDFRTADIRYNAGGQVHQDNEAHDQLEALDQ